MSSRKDELQKPPGFPPDPSSNPDLTQLRSRAEQQLQELDSQETNAQWPAEARRVLHELQVHQVELEMQKEELRATQKELEASRARYFDLYDLAPVGYVTVSQGGIILETNLTAAVLLGVARNALPRQRLSRFILSDDQEIYYFLLRTFSETVGAQSCELRMTKKDGAHFWARLDAVVAQDEGGALSRRIVISDITERKRHRKNPSPAKSA